MCVSARMARSLSAFERPQRTEEAASRDEAKSRIAVPVRDTDRSDPDIAGQKPDRTKGLREVSIVTGAARSRRCRSFMKANQVILWCAHTPVPGEDHGRSVSPRSVVRPGVVEAKN